MIAILTYIGLTATAVFFYFREYGVHTLISADSAYYISAGRSFISGNGLTAFDGSAFLYWPPLYPIVLAGFEILGLDAAQHSVIINVGLLGILAVLVGMWLRRTTGNPWLGLLGVIAVLVSKPLWIVGIYAWSESLFALSVFAALVAAERFVRWERKSALYLAAAFSGVAILTRYVGVFLIISIVVYLFFSRDVHGRFRWKETFLYGILAIVPGILSWARTMLASGQLSGDRAPPAILTLQEIGRELSGAISNWLVPWSVDYQLKIIAMGVIGLLIWTLLRVLRSRNEIDQAQKETAARPFLVYVVVYSLGLVGLKFITGFSDLNDRILSPLYAPLFSWALYFCWSSSQRIDSSLAKQIVRIAILVVFLTWAGRSAVMLPRYLNQAYANQMPLSSARWTNSATLKALAVDGSPALIYSNIPHAIYIHTGLDAKEAPRKHFFGVPNIPTSDLEEFRWGVAETGEVTLVWFEIDQGTYMITIDELREHYDVVKTAQYEDGAVYRVRLTN